MRLASFNILHGRSMEDDRVDVGRFADAVRALDADIFALQEVDRDQPRSALADLTAVAAQAMGALDHRFAAALCGHPGAWSAATGEERPGTASYGIALLSRYPARSWQVARLPSIGYRFPMYLATPRKVAVITDEPRVALSGVFDTPFGELTVANTHLSYVPGWNVRQLRRLKGELAPRPDPLILMGDLNLRGRRPSAVTGYTSLARGLTFPAAVPDRQIDHILLRGRLAPVRDTATRLLPLSDHRALTVDL